MENPTVKKKPSSYFGEYLDRTNIYQRIRQAEYYATGFFLGLFSSCLAQMIYQHYCSEEALKFFAKGWPIPVILIGSALLGVAVQYLFDPYCNRDSNQLVTNIDIDIPMQNRPSVT